MRTVHPTLLSMSLKIQAIEQQPCSEPLMFAALRVIPAIEEAVASMKAGGIRRIIVPVELGYPNNDFNQQGPKPSTFSVRTLGVPVVQQQE